MKRVLMGLVLGLALLGCKTPEAVTNPPTVEFRYDHYFMQGAQRLLFKTRLKLAKEEFSGVLVVKETEPQVYRSVFTTETGFKIFDLSIRNDGYTVNYGVGAIKKKFIAVRLAYTIQALLLRSLPATFEVKVEADLETGRFAQGKYTYSIQKNGLRARVQTVGLGKKSKAEAHFSDFGSDNIPDSATVTHFGFPLTASFRFLKQ